MGCSEGYHFNLVKSHLPAGTHLQGQEQIHAELVKKCVSSLQKVTPDILMIFMRLFFAMTNEKHKNKYL